MRKLTIPEIKHAIREWELAKDAWWEQHLLGELTASTIVEMANKTIESLQTMLKEQEAL